MPQIVVIIPCYNESKRLNVQEFKDFSSPNFSIRFHFVNDGSQDDTIDHLERLHAFDPQRFTICNLPRNMGKAEAVRTGILQAFEANPEFVGYWDADLATPLNAISAFHDVLSRKPTLGMVFGARVLLLGRSIERRSIRHYPGRIFATAASAVLGLSIYDTQCGAKLFRTSPLIKSLFQEPFGTRWIFDVEILARLIKTCREGSFPQPQDIIYEYPLDEWRDVAGSKVKARDFASAFVDLLKVYLKYFCRHKGTNPDSACQRLLEVAQAASEKNVSCKK
jgi:glycosyltransferase involved in cell wall biosynthesis